MKQMKQKTPNLESNYVIQFCRDVVPDSSALILEVKSIGDVPEKDCYAVVDNKVATCGGESIFGWIITEFPCLIIEATAHAVWRNPSGELEDIAPQGVKLSKHLFLPDSNSNYEGKQIPNIRKALYDHPAVHQFIESRRLEFEVLNKGERAEQVGVISMRQDEWFPIATAMKEADRAMADLIPGRNDKCLCGSGIKAKRCCFGG